MIVFGKQLLFWQPMKGMFVKEWLQLAGCYSLFVKASLPRNCGKGYSKL